MITDATHDDTKDRRALVQFTHALARVDKEISDSGVTASHAWPVSCTLTVMAAVQFYESFWVAVATAAPVIGLASAVTADQTVRRLERAKGKPAAWPPPWFTFSVTGFNVMLQTLALAFALISLSTRGDLVSRLIPIVMEIVGMVLVFVPTYASILR